jgi:hypothetical protein
MCDYSQQFVVKISLSGCGLTGSIPDSTIFSLQGLLELNLGNEFYPQGPHPKHFGLTGTLPADLCTATQLQKLTLNGNSFTGTIPNLSGLTALQSLDLHYNQLGGALPPLASADIRYISFATNRFKGEIPSSWSKLRSVQIVGLANNQLTGSVAILATLNELLVVFLRNNSFTGEIPVLPLNVSVADFDHNKFSSIAAQDAMLPAFRNACGCSSDYPDQPFGTCCFANNSFPPSPHAPATANCFSKVPCRGPRHAEGTPF